MTQNNLTKTQNETKTHNENIGKFWFNINFPNNILNSVMTKKLLNNFSQNVRKWKYNKMKQSLYYVLTYCKYEFVETMLEEIKEALNNTKLTIPKGYDKYMINVNFNDYFAYSLPRFLFKNEFFNREEYTTPTKFKKFVLTEIEECLDKYTNEYILECFEKAFNKNDYYYRNNSTNPITVNYNVNYSNHKKESELKYSNKLHNLLCRSFMIKGKFKISK